MGRRRSAAAGILNLKTGLLPIARKDARVLILGSLPGDASLAMGQYYAHPRNHFWKLLSCVIGVDLVAMDYATRIGTLQFAKIALWDVVRTADRPGSLDHQIRNAQPNDLRNFVSGLAQLRAVAMNGKKAAALAVNILSPVATDIIYLPSSSPAYTLDFELKAAAWIQLRSYLF